MVESPTPANIDDRNMEYFVAAYLQEIQNNPKIAGFIAEIASCSIATLLYGTNNTEHNQHVVPKTISQAKCKLFPSTYPPIPVHFLTSFINHQRNSKK